MSQPLLSIENLSTWIDTGDAPVRAVDGLSLTIERGETFALLGESGCGKSITALSVMRLLPEAGRVVDGRVLLDGVDLLQLPETEMRSVRGARVGMIFQEPMLSLNPVLTIGAQIIEVLEQHTEMRTREAQHKARELLDSVGVPESARRLHEYPFQLSGGLRQRVMIAMALACEPDLLIADELTTALDVTIQAQVLDLLRELQRTRAMSMLLITHDLGVVAGAAHRVGVMYAGQIVETASVAELFARPLMPYTRALLETRPKLGCSLVPGYRLRPIPGQAPRPMHLPPGCAFAPRCAHVEERCSAPQPLDAPADERLVRCVRWPELEGRR